MQNYLKNQTSPYLLQHADNPVNWYPWCEEAFQKAKEEEKPVFLSIGYSTCHWCHVMAHESFEDKEIAAILNENFISIKVDKEERPDIDSIYMSVCQALTGSGGWPTTIFMTPEQKPFFAGTYFPKNARWGSISFHELIETIADKWKHERNALLESADEILHVLKKEEPFKKKTLSSPEHLFEAALRIYSQTFDKTNGGFGQAPKFPSPHNLLFLMHYYKKTNHKPALEMVEKTLVQMYRGGIFDHIGGGFSRYSTDKYFLAPHFEKMLYDYRKKRYHLHLDDKILTSWNGLMISAMCHLYRVTQTTKYLNAAEQSQNFIENNLCEENSLFVSWRDERHSGKGFLDDYANEIFALLSLYEATLNHSYLSRAKVLCNKCLSLFYDKTSSGFFLNGSENEKLIMRPKETYDGAMPSGNSMMAYNLLRLSQYYENDDYASFAEAQLRFMITEVSSYPAGYVMFLNALLDYVELPASIK